MRRLSLLPLLILALISSPLSSTSGAATAPPEQSTGPVIASGRLLDASGRSTVGSVELLAWPPAESQQVGDVVSLIPIAKAPVARDGNFTLRAAETPELVALATANGGYVNLELHAVSGGAVEETHFSRYLAPSDDFRTLDAERLGGTWLARPEEPAKHITVRFPQSSGLQAQGLDESTKVPVLGGCSPPRLLEKTAVDTVIGELRTEPDTADARFIYGKTADSDISVAVRMGGGNWSLSGEHHVSNTGSSDVTQHASHDEHLTVLSSFEYGHYEYSCTSGGKREKVKSLGWRGGGLTPRPTTHRGCSYASELNLFRFGKRGEFKRENERAVTWGGAAGVYGASLSARSGYSKFVHANWKFGSDSEHLLCGDDNNPSKSSHIFAGQSTPTEAACRAGQPC